MDAAEMQKRAKALAGGIQDLGKRAFANPLSALLTALAAGFVCGLVLRLFERTPSEREEK
jgi:hypothetical protein